MIKELRLESWKGFQKSTLHIDPFVVLTGANASGKSNALEALHFLGRSATGVPLSTIVQGDNNAPGLGGGKDGARHEGEDRFALVAVISGEKNDTDFEYRIEVSVKGAPQLHAESLRKITYRKTGRVQSDIQLFFTDVCEDDQPAITARLYNRSQGTPRALGRQATILSQLYPEASAQALKSTICEGVICVREALSKIFILDPVPSHMRSYSPLSDNLNSDAGNIAGVIAALDGPRKKEAEENLAHYAKELPAREISNISAVTVGHFDSDAMLYCEEKWGEETLCVDARGMSDGTLRFLAILLALLLRPEHSLLVVGEMDKSLHPSSAQLLLDALRAQGKKRAIDILVTTHNPALLDSLEPEMTPFITLCHRNTETGASQLTLLEDLPMLLKLLSTGSLGTLAREGKLEAALQG